MSSRNSHMGENEEAEIEAVEEEVFEDRAPNLRGSGSVHREDLNNLQDAILDARISPREPFVATSVSSHSTTESEHEKQLALARIRANPIGKFMEYILGTQLNTGTVPEPHQFGAIADMLEEMPPLVTQAQLASMQGGFTSDMFMTMFKQMSLQTSNGWSITIEAPKKFGKHPTLSSSDAGRHGVIRIWFPPRMRFTGENKKGEPDVCELLAILRTSQSHALLSEEEFRTKLLEYFTGACFGVVSTWVYADISIDELYRKIVDRYYVGDSP
jgi:hypothetical protein